MTAKASNEVHRSCFGFGDGLCHRDLVESEEEEFQRDECGKC